MQKNLPDRDEVVRFQSANSMFADGKYSDQPFPWRH